jgi:hypothetical protein
MFVDLTRTCQINKKLFINGRYFMFYQRGSKGDEVKKIQVKLKELGYYLGPTDGIFGGGTESAVKSFQKEHSLTPDGKVGQQTWAALFAEEEMPQPDILTKTLDWRCLALTGSFETDAPVPECFAGLTGDFDDEGISFGVLQWNFGQKSLQPLLLKMNQQHPDVLKEIFHEEYEEFLSVLNADYEEQMAWARSIQNLKNEFHEPWRGLFKTLGRTKEFQEIQVKHASNLYQDALSLCRQYSVWSERAVALMFDIKTQNGSISALVGAQIHKDFGQLAPSLNGQEREVAKLRIIANRRAEAAKPRWVEDVRKRKLCCANGEGTVHGRYYDLEGQYGIRLQRAQEFA